MLERTAHPRDGRAQALALSPPGRTLVPRLAVVADENDTHFFAALAPDERRLLRDLLRKIALSHALRKAPTE